VIVRAIGRKTGILARPPKRHPRRIGQEAHARGDADMPSQPMQDVIDGLRERRKASTSQAPPTLAERRAAFTPGDRLHPVPDDVLIREGTGDEVPAYWLAAPGADAGRVLLFLHGGGYELGSLRSDGELAARLGRASGMRVLFPEYRLAPEHPFPAAIDDVLAAWRWLRTGQDLSASSIAVAGDSAGGGLAVALLVAVRDAGGGIARGRRTDVPDGGFD
jgi:epsilon-lactone hydrolase